MWPENAHYSHVKTNWRRAGYYCATCGESGSDVVVRCRGVNRCGVCRFSRRHAGALECARRSPVCGADGNPIWPVVEDGFLCGDFEVRYEREGK